LLALQLAAGQAILHSPFSKGFFGVQDTADKIETVTISSLGAQADGLAQTAQGEKLFIPFTLPGEKVKIRRLHAHADGVQGTVVELITPSAERVIPPCPAYGRCGGCVLQHWQAEAQADWKRARLEGELKRRHLPQNVLAPIIALPAGERRRVSITVEGQANGQVALGFYRRASRALVAIHQCMVLSPALNQLLPALPAALTGLLAQGEQWQIHLLAAENGVDVTIFAKQPASLAIREQLAAFAHAKALCRISWAAPRRPGSAQHIPPEPLIIRTPPLIQIAKVALTPPAAVFLQASKAGEEALQREVMAGGPFTGPCADLFCGLGTFSLPLLHHNRVMAVDLPGPTLDCLKAYAKGLADKRLEVVGEDLFKNPLPPDMLNRFDTVLFDPPRSGALAQARHLAQSRVRQIIAISCDPVTLVRDIALLTAGGYELIKLVPIDQFAWSAHVEAVAILRRPKDSQRY
jgi:23S rRNA (uracil1939-C5)-methyltransferase